MVVGGVLVPYIKKSIREQFGINKLFNCYSDVGELNYVLTIVIKEYMQEKGLNYTVANGIVGALECCKHEFQRRILDPYEDKKIKENGDVY